MQPDPESTPTPVMDKFVLRALIVLFCVWGAAFPLVWLALVLLGQEVPLVVIVVAVGLINFVLGVFGGRQIKL